MRCENCKRLLSESEPVYRVAKGYGEYPTFAAVYSACMECAQDAAVYRRRRRSRKQTTTICTQCAEPFELKRSDSRYCSSACRQAAYRQRLANNP